MYKPMNQIIVTLCLALCLTIVTSCNKATVSKETLAIEASLFLENEQAELALDLLRQHSEKYPNDTEILKLTGLSYLQLNDPSAAAPYFEKALMINPSDESLLLLSFQSKKDAGLDLSQVLMQVAKKFPNQLQAADWIRLSDLFAQEEQFEEAINAQFLALGTNQLTQETPIGSAFNVAQYYKNLNNTQAARPWFEHVSKSNSIEAFSAFLDLIEIYAGEENWDDLKSTIDQFNTRFPGALEASKYANIEARIPSKPIIETEKMAPTTAVTKNSINEIQDLETLANQIAESITDLENEADTLYAEYNPEIQIQPADPDLSAVTPDVAPSEIEEPFIPLSPSEIEIMIIKANNALLANDLDTAIQLYQNILKSDPSRHSIWNRLSQTQQSNNELKAASDSALEAIKLSPDTINYTLNYLQIAGQTKPGKQVLFDLISASERFPNSPEITLSLARAYDRIRSSFKAIELYKKFITLAPNHSLRPEAESAIARLTN